MAKKTKAKKEILPNTVTGKIGRRFKGGYKIIDFNNVDLASGATIKGIYEEFEKNYGKPILVTGINYGGQHIPAFFANVNLFEGLFVFPIAGGVMADGSDRQILFYSMSVTDEDYCHTWEYESKEYSGDIPTTDELVIEFTNDDYESSTNSFRKRTTTEKITELNSYLTDYSMAKSVLVKFDYLYGGSIPDKGSFKITSVEADYQGYIRGYGIWSGYDCIVEGSTGSSAGPMITLTRLSH